MKLGTIFCLVTFILGAGLSIVQLWFQPLAADTFVKVLVDAGSPCSWWPWERCWPRASSSRTGDSETPATSTDVDTEWHTTRRTSVGE